MTVGEWATLLAVVAQAIVQLWRIERFHQRQIADRKARVAEVRNDIRVNTALTKEAAAEAAKAYKEANDVNQKIAQLGRKP